MKRRPAAVFLDRDGTIIRDPGYVDDPGAVALLPRTGEAIARLNARGIPAVVVTNQSGIGRGMYGEADFRAVQAEVERRLAFRGAALDAVYYCPHHPEAGCGCRKPALGMYREAAERLGIRLEAAAYVGDKVKDVLPAVRTGGKGYLVRSGAEAPESPPAGCTVVADLWEAVDRILPGADGADREAAEERRPGGDG